MATNVYEMREASRLAFSIDKKGYLKPYDQSSSRYNDAGFTDKGVYSVAGGPDGIHAGLVGIRQDEDITLAFKGTDGPLDWINDVLANPVPFYPYGPGSVHMGFFSAVLFISGELISKTLQLYKSGKKIYVTGHSKGGAMATLMAKMLQKEIPGVSLEVYTFGSPRVGDSTFKNNYGLTHHRYEAFLDGITHLPLTKDESTLLDRLGTFHDKLAGFTKLLPYSPVGKRICLNSKDHSPFGKLPAEPDGTAEALNSFCCVEEALRKGGTNLVMNDVHNNDYYFQKPVK